MNRKDTVRVVLPESTKVLSLNRRKIEMQKVSGYFLWILSTVVSKVAAARNLTGLFADSTTHDSYLFIYTYMNL